MSNPEDDMVSKVEVTAEPEGTVVDYETDGHPSGTVYQSPH